MTSLCKTNKDNKCENKCYKILDNIELFIWYVEKPEQIKFVNKSFADFFGKTENYFNNIFLSEIMSDDLLKYCLDINYKIFETGKKTITEEWVTDKNNNKKLWRITRVPKLNSKNIVEYFIATAEDITDTYYIKSTYENLINNISDIIFIIDLEGLFTFVSPSVIQLGYNQDDVINTHFIDYVYNKDISKRILEFNKLIPKKNTILEFRVKLKNNKYIWMRCNVKYIEKEIYVILSNIHERKLKELELESIFQNDLFAIFISKNGICVNQNKKAEELFGYTLEEVIGNLIINFFDDNDKERVKQNIMTNYTGLYIVNGKHKNGKIFKIVVQGNPFKINEEIYRMSFIREYS